MKSLTELSKDERSLLLYFETLAVDHRGIIDDPRKMNDVDREIALQWDADGFVSYKRFTKRSADDEVEQLSYAIDLSDEAWSLAHQERRARALRMKPKE